MPNCSWERWCSFYQAVNTWHIWIFQSTSLQVQRLYLRTRAAFVTELKNWCPCNISWHLVISPSLCTLLRATLWCILHVLDFHHQGISWKDDCTNLRILFGIIIFAQATSTLMSRDLGLCLHTHEAWKPVCIFVLLISCFGELQLHCSFDCCICLFLVWVRALYELHW